MRYLDYLPVITAFLCKPYGRFKNNDTKDPVDRLFCNSIFYLKVGSKMYSFKIARMYLSNYLSVYLFVAKLITSLSKKNKIVYNSTF